MKIIEHSDEKLRNAVLIFATRTKYVGITKLMKLLYYLDFWHYKETGFPVTGQSYKAWPCGPVPKKVWDEVKENCASYGLSNVIRVAKIPYSEDVIGLKVIPCPGAKVNERVFSRRERRIIERIIEIFAEAKTHDMVTASHERGEPWARTIKSCGEGCEIKFELILSGVTPEAREQITELQNFDREARAMLESV